MSCCKSCSLLKYQVRVLEINNKELQQRLKDKDKVLQRTRAEVNHLYHLIDQQEEEVFEAARDLWQKEKQELLAQLYSLAFPSP